MTIIKHFISTHQKLYLNKTFFAMNKSKDSIKIEVKIITKELDKWKYSYNSIHNMKAITNYK